MKILVFLFVAATMLLSSSMLFAMPVHYNAPPGQTFNLANNAPMSHSGEASTSKSKYTMDGQYLTAFHIVCEGILGSCYAMDSDMGGITVGTVVGEPSGDSVSQITDGVAEEVVNP